MMLNIYKKYSSQVIVQKHLFCTTKAQLKENGKELSSYNQVITILKKQGFIVKANSNLYKGQQEAFNLELQPIYVKNRLAFHHP